MAPQQKSTNTLMPVNAVVGRSFRTAVPTHSEALVFPEMFFKLRSLGPVKFLAGQCWLRASWVLSRPGERHGRQQDPKPLPLLWSFQRCHRASEFLKMALSRTTGQVPNVPVYLTEEHTRP